MLTGRRGGAEKQNEVVERRNDVRAAVHDFLESVWDVGHVRAALEGAELPNAELWRGFAEDLGLAGILVPEDLGGAGGSLADAEVISEELGASLAPVPFLMTAVVGAQVLQLCGSPLLASLIEGRTRVALVEARGTVRVAGDQLPVLTGAVSGVLEGADAEILLVVADDRSGSPTLYLVEGAATTPEIGLDPSLALARVTFDGTPATKLSADAAVIERGRSLVSLGVAAMQVGVARRSMELTAKHVGERVQFGRPIGSYQAIKHRLADMLVTTETAVSAVARSVRTLTADAPTAGADAALAAWWASRAARRVTAEMIQLHGGMGFTWEHDAHLLYRRAHALSALAGNEEAALDHAWAADVLNAEEEPLDGGERDAEVVETVRAFIRAEWDAGHTVAEWWRRMADARLTIPSLPAELGGRGWTRADESVVNEEISAAGATLAPGAGSAQPVAEPRSHGRNSGLPIGANDRARPSPS